MINLDQFIGTYPYASELFGVYQPLLGWKSKQGKKRVADETRQLFGAVMKSMQQDSRLHVYSDDAPTPTQVDMLVGAHLPTWMDSSLGRSIQTQVNTILTTYNRPPKTEEWQNIVNQDNFKDTLKSAALELNAIHKAMELKIECGDLVFFEKNALTPEEFGIIGAVEITGTNQMAAPKSHLQLHDKIQRETALAGTLLHLLNVSPELLNEMFIGPKATWEIARDYLDPLASFDPQTQEAMLSPVGIVQLYRQYFFELDSFLGPPVGHVWISPGSTVELIEVSTRRTLTERYMELFQSTTARSELETIEKEELSSVVKQENQRSMSLGVSASGGGNFGVYHFEASANFGLQATQLKSQEEAHKYMRQQSERLTNEIRKHFRTTFRTVTEVEDSASRRYKLENATDQLVNFELKRKMRRVGVQVQHVGTRLCWQVYLDEPGIDLGIAELVHVAKPTDTQGSAQPPEAPAVLEPKATPFTVNFPYQADGTGDDRGATFYEGSDRDSGILRGSPERIIWQRNFTAQPPDAGYKLNPNGVLEIAVERVDPDEDPPEVAASYEVVGDNEIRISLSQVNFHNQPSIRFILELMWEPPNQEAANEAYQQKLDEFTKKQEREERSALLDAVKERIEMASDIQSRSDHVLRQEERIVVFRRLIRQLMRVGQGQGTHVTAELIRSLFEVDNILYFVAPDWWRARGRPSGYQQLGNSDTPSPISGQDVVGWGGVRAQNRDNYLITEESQPAPLGASIGWLLQLDGDEHRNAFLNSPWIKAVIPIRPGREVAALNWLEYAHVEGTDGLDAVYQGPEPELNGRPLYEVLNIMAQSLADQNKDVANILATETVFENGFDPLAGGFVASGQPFELFDQWVEVLPTDQVVAVEYSAP